MDFDLRSTREAVSGVVTMVHEASVDDWRKAARRRLPKVLFEYIDGGSYAEETLRRNVEDLAAVVLRQRVMRDMSKVDLSTTLFGQEFAFPVALGPVGFAGMYARRGEVQAALAATSAGIPFCLSTVGICEIGEVARVTARPWFQLYAIKDRGAMRDLLSLARTHASQVLIVTVDLPTPGPRYRDVRTGMSGTPRLSARIHQALDALGRPDWLWNVYLRGRPHRFGNLRAVAPHASSFADAWQWIGANFDPSFTWADLDFIREQWSGPIVIKGILDVEDAKIAVRAGADGIVVSNHGGRQLDGAASTASVLPAIVDSIGGGVPIMVDGGVRSGLDVLKMLALGANACLIGRAWAYALAAGGEKGITAMLASFRAELNTAMVLTGCTSIKGARASLSQPPSYKSKP